MHYGTPPAVEHGWYTELSFWMVSHALTILLIAGAVIAILVLLASRDLVAATTISIASMFIVTLFGVLLFGIPATSGEMDQQYSDLEWSQIPFPLELQCSEWAEYFKDAAHADEQGQWKRGGDSQNGELAIYYQRAAEQDASCMDSLNVERRYYDSVCAYDVNRNNCQHEHDQ